MTVMKPRLWAFAFGFVLLLAGVAHAQTVERGAVTNLPIPRFVSLKASEGNLRRGPGLGHRIDWVLKRRAMPLEVIGEYGHWRRVRDRDGAAGWMHYALLSGVRTVLIEEDMLAMRAKPSGEGIVRARAELGVVAHLGKCEPTWCMISADGYKGWVPKTAIWGVGPDEIRD
jgi:SH3-like domain-containing protein